MSKRLTMSVSLAFALAMSSGVALAGGHGGALPAPQGLAPSPQGVMAAPQGYVEYAEPCPPKHCGFKLPEICLPKLHMPKICMPKICLPKIECAPKCYEYEWVLKKKRCGGGLLGACHKHDECGYGEVYATEQYASPQAAPAYPTGQVYGAGQMTAPGTMEPAPAVETDEAPEAPVVPSAYGRLGSSLFGTTR
nr:hypothetical protein [Tautonia sociabilis]